MRPKTTYKGSSAIRVPREMAKEDFTNPDRTPDYKLSLRDLLGDAPEESERIFSEHLRRKRDKVLEDPYDLLGLI